MATRPSAFRDDILASRGWFAVLIVVYHLWHVPSGGPVGIDLFFVISGYLITRQLVEERTRTGRVSMVAFVARRIRRIAPVAVLVIVVTVLVSAIVWFLPRAIVVAGDGASALGLVANWHFIADQHSYLEPSGTPSPLEHTWSLSVEEQFYLVWPLLVVLATLTVLPGARRKVVGRVVAVALVALVATAAYSAWRTAAAPEAAYFDTVARSWEFIPGIVGGALASTIDRIDVRVRTLVGSVGFLVLTASAIWLEPSVGFPWPGAVPSVFGAALFVAFGVHVSAAHRVLTIAPARYLGRISYPLYLWHFPVVILLPAALGRSTPVLVAAALLSVLLAALTAHWVETPVLRSQWLRHWMSGVHRPLRAARNLPPIGRRTVLTVSAVAVVVVVLGATAVTVPSRGSVRATAAVADLVGLSRPGPLRVWTDDAELERAVDSALTSTQWPAALEPALDRAFTTTIAEEFDEASGCRYPADVVGADVRPCDAGPVSAVRNALLVGDSTAAAWAPGVVDALVPLGWRVRTLAFSACSPFPVPGAGGFLTDGTRGGAAADQACAASRARALALAADVRPDLVIVSAGGETWTERAREVAPGDRSDFGYRWEKAVIDGVAHYRRVADRVVVLGPAPNGLHTADCAVRFDGPDRCEATLPEAEVRASCVEGIDCVDVTRWFCDDERRCPAFIGDTLVRADRSHLTARMTKSLSDLLRRALVRDPV